MLPLQIEKMFSLSGIRPDLLVILVAAARIAAAAPLVAQVAPTLRVGLVSSGDSAVTTALSIERGVRLGAFEAKQTANLFGGDVLLVEAIGGGDPVRAAQKLLSERKVEVLLGSSAEDVDALARFAESHRLIFVNVASRATSLRAACHRYAFHVEATDSMYAIAARHAGQPAPTSNTVMLWAPTLERYGASQINDRYRARYRLPMDAGAWAGWVGVKIVAEAALRARSGQPGAILAYLESPAANFDGHKGWPLSFRLTDHQLRQPLYVSPPTAGGSRVGVREIPQISAMAEGDGIAGANRALDTLMPASGGCSWSPHQ